MHGVDRATRFDQSRAAVPDVYDAVTTGMGSDCRVQHPNFS